MPFSPPNLEQILSAPATQEKLSPINYFSIRPVNDSDPSQPLKLQPAEIRPNANVFGTFQAYLSDNFKINDNIPNRLPLDYAIAGQQYMCPYWVLGEVRFHKDGRPILEFIENGPNSTKSRTFIARDAITNLEFIVRAELNVLFYVKCSKRQRRDKKHSSTQPYFTSITEICNYYKSQQFIRNDHDTWDIIAYTN